VWYGEMDAVKLITLETAAGYRLGVVVAGGIVDVSAAAAVLGEDVPKDIHSAITGGQEALAALEGLAMRAAAHRDLVTPEGAVALGPSVTHPQKILCVGLNYRRHADEVGLARPTTPVLFSKFANALAGSGTVIPMPQGVSQFDYEGEMAIVIGRRARDVAQSDALQYVFGYCTANDASARDLQFRTSQWLLGKTLDKFCPVGPYVVTADEVPNPDALAIRTWVNGEIRQDSNTSDMIFSCAHIISYASRYMTLEPGDLILTGTPEGVVVGYPEERRATHWLRSGDEVVVEVEGLGRLVNRMGA